MATPVRTEAVTPVRTEAVTPVHTPVHTLVRTAAVTPVHIEAATPVVTLVVMAGLPLDAVRVTPQVVLAVNISKI